MALRETSVWCGLMGVATVGATLLQSDGSVLGAASAAAGAGVLTNIVSHRLDGLWTRFRDGRLARVSAGLRLDANHDEARAIREAQLESLRNVVHRYRELAGAFSPAFAADKDFASRAMKWVELENGNFSTLEVRHDAIVEAAVRRAVDGALTGALSKTRSPLAIEDAQLWRSAAEVAVLDELRTAVGDEPPEDFLREFFDLEHGWFSGFTVQISAKIKSKPEVAAIWLAMRTAWLGERVDDLDRTLASLHDLAAKLDASVFGDPPIQLHLPHLHNVTPEHRFSFKNANTAFVGRAKELAELDAFLDSDAIFSWHLISGDGGVGKSRVALELCLRRQGAWRTGFVLSSAASAESLSAAKKWTPRKPHLIVVDFTLSVAAFTERLLATFAVQSLSYSEKVRVLLIERASDVYDGVQVWQTSASREEIRKTRWKDAPMVLSKQESKAIWQMAQPLLAGKTARAHFLKRHQRIDPQQRALTALILADALGRGSDVTSFEELFAELLIHERNVWRAYGVNDAEEEVLAFASLVNGFVPSRDRAIIPEAVAEKLTPTHSAAALRRISPPPNSSEVGAIGGYKPDLIGEFFTLDLLARKQPGDGLTTGASRHWTLDAAWGVDDGWPMLDFALRAFRDFRELSARVGIFEPQQGVANSYFAHALFDLFPERVRSLHSAERAALQVIEYLRVQTPCRVAHHALGMFLQYAVRASYPLFSKPFLEAQLRDFSVLAREEDDELVDLWAECVMRLWTDKDYSDPRPILDALLVIAEHPKAPRLSERMLLNMLVNTGALMRASREEHAQAPALMQALNSMFNERLKSEVLAEEWGKVTAHFADRWALSEPNLVSTLIARLKDVVERFPNHTGLQLSYMRALAASITSPTADLAHCRTVLRRVERAALATKDQDILVAWSDGVTRFCTKFANSEASECQTLIRRLRRRSEHHDNDMRLWDDLAKALSLSVLWHVPFLDPDTPRHMQALSDRAIASPLDSALLYRFTTAFANYTIAGMLNKIDLSDMMGRLSDKLVSGDIPAHTLDAWATAVMNYSAPYSIGTDARRYVDLLEERAWRPRATERVREQWVSAASNHIKTLIRDGSPAIPMYRKIEQRVLRRRNAKMLETWASCASEVVQSSWQSHSGDAKQILYALVEQAATRPQMMFLAEACVVCLEKIGGETGAKLLITDPLPPALQRPDAPANLVTAWLKLCQSLPK